MNVSVKIVRIPLLCIALMLVLLPLSVHAAWQPIVRNFQVQDYEAGTQNWQLLQADNGWMYAANNQGLLEYDGSSWHLYGLWYSSPLRSIAQGEDGLVYAGGLNECGYFAPNKFGRMVYTSLVDSLPQSYRTFGDVWNVYYDEGYVYMQSRHYILVINPEHHVDVIDPACVVYSSLVQDHTLYIATSQGLCLYSGHRLHPLIGSDALVGYQVADMKPYGPHSFLIATDFGGVFVYDGTSVKPFSTSVDAFLRKNQLFSLAVSPSFIAFGTVQAGAVVTNRRGGQPTYIGRPQGLQNATILSAAFDKDENLWLGLDQGMSLVLLQSPLRFHRSRQQSLGTGYSYAEHGGFAYYATNQGLYCQPLQQDVCTLMDGTSGQAWKLCRMGESLLCCHNRGLFEVHGDKVRQIALSEGVWDVLPLADGRAIACTYSGFYLLGTRTGQVEVMRTIRNYDETALYTCIDRWSRLWTISSKGVECLTFDKDYTSVTSQLVLSDPTRSQYSIARVGDEVVISGHNMLSYVAEDMSLVEADSLANMLAGKRRYSLLQQAPDGSLVFIYDGRLLYLPSPITNNPSSIEVLNDPRFFVGGFANVGFSSNNQAVVGGVDGFYMLSLQQRKASTSKVHVYLRGIEHNELGLLYGERALGLHDSLTAEAPAQIKLENGHYLLRAHFCGDIVNRQGAMFQTRLLPDEKEFTEWTTDPFRDLVLLSSGKHVLEVRMHLTDAEDAFTSVEISVAKPWYRAWWAYLIYIILLLLFVAAVYQYFIHRLRRSQQLVAAEKEAEIRQQEVRILQLEQEQSQFDLKAKSRELNSVLLNQVNRNEFTASLHTDVRRIIDLLAHNETETAKRYLQQLDARLSAGHHHDKDWKRFEENFDFINDRFIRRLTSHYPWLSKSERKLCIYIYMGLQTKDIAPLLGLSTRGVEMMRYRLRQKMQLEPQLNLKSYFEELVSQENLS